RLSCTVAGSLTKAALGKESATGAGTPEFEVIHNIPSVPAALAATHPVGSSGGVTSSKFSRKILVGFGHGGVGVGVGVGAGVGVGVGEADAVAVAVAVPVAVAVGVGLGQIIPSV